MMKIAYMQPNGVVAIATAASKESIERKLGEMNDEQYKDHVIERSVPKGVPFRLIDDAEIPPSREFRNAWVDMGDKISIDCEKARDWQLVKLREARNKYLAATDTLVTRAMESNDSKSIDGLSIKRKALRDITEPLKALSVTGKNDDEALLNQIRDVAGYSLIQQGADYVLIENP